MNVSAVLFGHPKSSEDQWLQFGNGYDPSTRITIKARRLTGETLNSIMWHPKCFVCFVVHQIVVVFDGLTMFTPTKMEFEKCFRPESSELKPWCFH